MSEACLCMHMHHSGTTRVNIQPHVSMAMNNYSPDNKPVSPQSWTLMTFARAFWGIVNQIETNGRKELKERDTWTGCRRHQNTRRTRGRKHSSSVPNDVSIVTVTKLTVLSFWEGRGHLLPPPYPCLLGSICSPRFMPCSKNREADRWDGPLSFLAFWLRVGFGQWEALA